MAARQELPVVALKSGQKLQGEPTIDLTAVLTELGVELAGPEDAALVLQVQKEMQVQKLRHDVYLAACRITVGEAGQKAGGLLSLKRHAMAAAYKEHTARDEACQQAVQLIAEPLLLRLMRYGAVETAE